MKVRMKYAYPEQGTRNGRIYPPDVLEKAFNEPAFKEACENIELPIVSEDNHLIGMGTAWLEDGRVVTIDGEISHPTYVKLLSDYKDKAVFTFTLYGTGAVEHTDDKAVVTEVKFLSAMFTPHPAVDICSVELEEG